MSTEGDPLDLLQGTLDLLILRTLQAVSWVIGGPKGAAAKLGLKRTTLIHKMKRLGISRPLPDSGEDRLEPPLHGQDPLPRL